MKIADLEISIAHQESYFHLGKSAEEAFPFLREHTVRVGGQFAGPLSTLQAVTRWLWLIVHSDKTDEYISSILHQLIERSLAASELSGGNYCRPEHDAFLMLVAALSGNKAWMKVVSEAVSVANSDVMQYQFFQAWTGILRARVLNLANEEAIQTGILLRKRGLSGYGCHSHALVKAFAASNYSKFKSLLSKLDKYELDAAKTDGTISRDSEGNPMISVRWRDPNRFWPWAEAGFAKLIWIGGGAIQLDALWLPERLINLKS